MRSRSAWDLLELVRSRPASRILPDGEASGTQNPYEVMVGDNTSNIVIIQISFDNIDIVDILWIRSEETGDAVGLGEKKQAILEGDEIPGFI